MRYVLVFLIFLFGISGEAMAGKKKIIKGNQGPTTVDSSCNCNGVVNKGHINGGNQTGLTVTGSAAQSVTNNGTITGSTGLLVSGSSSVVTNNGTIKGSSVGVSQVP